MPISIDRAQQHVSDWVGKLGPFPRRKAWPKYLFHTCDISVVRAIVEKGALLTRSRAEEETGIICDCANQGALWNNPAAHEFVRLYFRPRNSFHLKTEGIKSSSDPYRQDPHMTIPVTFAFNLEHVLILPESRFLNGNFAISGARVLDGDHDFDCLDFSMIYHDSPPPPERMYEYQNARMSEVVVQNELTLDVCHGLVVRTDFDRRSLQYALSGLNAPKIFLDQAGAIFFKRGICLSELTPIRDGLIFSFTGPIASPQENYKVEIQQGEFVKSYSVSSSKRWKVSTGETSDVPVKIYIEDCLAFEGLLPSTITTVV